MNFDNNEWFVSVQDQSLPFAATLKVNNQLLHQLQSSSGICPTIRFTDKMSAVSEIVSGPLTFRC